eukprot:CAMPEP_0169196732 /NCGR_PEP_ID=MMETSP1016-20121227/7889_1 /TAXON_ID=342587 /ORGANISM="Karlodinium micrum, Strain CCMP2283" /LENGTH=304 /DNA_ID=CAMNT_0009273327 /DNA_START=306 /DNA_END=1220 /DNA_ORIENTATION=+
MTSGKTLLAHREIQQWSSFHGLLPTALCNATIQAGLNIWAYSRGELSVRDVALTFLKDVRDGTVVWLVAKGFVTALTVGELRTSGVLASACSFALHYPVPATFGVLCLCFAAAGYAQRSMSGAELRQFHGNVVLHGASTATGLCATLASQAMGLSLLGSIVLTCAASNAAGIASHEIWRKLQESRAESRLRLIARELFGLPHAFTNEMLQRRWRTLARLAHPDRNRQADARKTFTIFQLCRDVLQADLAGRKRNSGKSRGLLRSLRNVGWLSRQDLPPMHYIPKPEPAHIGQCQQVEVPVRSPG